MNGIYFHSYFIINMLDNFFFMLFKMYTYIVTNFLKIK